MLGFFTHISLLLVKLSFSFLTKRQTLPGPREQAKPLEKDATDVTRRPMGCSFRSVALILFTSTCL